MAVITLTNGLECLVDESDLPLLKGITWVATKDRGRGSGLYAEGWDKLKKRPVRMHRVIMGAMKGQFIDHINKNGLDNRRSNLRFASHAQNCANRLNVKAASGFKGVFACSTPGKYEVKVWANGVDHRIGRFDCPIEAAKAYDEAARHHFGSFACLNFPIGSECRASSSVLENL